MCISTSSFARAQLSLSLSLLFASICRKTVQHYAKQLSWQELEHVLTWHIIACKCMQYHAMTIQVASILPTKFDDLNIPALSRGKRALWVNLASHPSRLSRTRCCRSFALRAVDWSRRDSLSALAAFGPWHPARRLNAIGPEATTTWSNKDGLEKRKSIMVPSDPSP